MKQIYYLNSSMLKEDESLLAYILQNSQNNYYWSDEFNDEFYIALAKAGFISTSHQEKDKLVLLPEIQHEYGVLDFKDVHISKKVKKLLHNKSLNLKMNSYFYDVLDAISHQHKYNWITGRYRELLEEMFVKHYDNFRVVSFELCVGDELISGEVGYVIGATYTSLSGFSSREKVYNNFGTLQLVKLSHYLESKGFKFWNFGHPHMEYKKRLGVKVYDRADFLQMWGKATTLPMINLS